MAATGSESQQVGDVDGAPRVSVVMIFLDGLPFMQEAVDSLRTQDFGDWELLLVDDGSGDGSSALAQAMAAADPARIRYLAHPGHANRGTSASRNLALAAARGRYLIRLDSDDVFESASSLGEQVALLDRHPGVAMVCGPCRYWNAWCGGNDAMQAWSHPQGLAAPGALLAAMLAPGDAEPVSMMLRTQAIRELGGWEEAIRDFGEDFILTAKLLLHRQAWVTDRCWYRYRMHPASYSRRVRQAGEQRQRERELHAWVADWLRREGLRDPAAWKGFARRRRDSREPRLPRPAREALGALREWGWRARLAWSRMLGARRASLVLDAETDSVAHPDALFRARARWSSVAPGRVQVRVGSPSGPAFASGLADGEAWTRDWAQRGMWFFLQDAEAADPGSASATLAVARLHVPVRAG